MNKLYLKNTLDKYSTVITNFKYISLLEIFTTLAPLITYPYLINTLGTELYGYVITAQVVASYAVIVVNFGFRSISARNVSIHRDNDSRLSEILSNILTIRLFLWIISFIIYFSLILNIGYFKDHFWLFLFSFGFTFNDLLFLQFYFQGIEKMKYITLINLTINSIFIILVFLLIKDTGDYLYVPLLRSIGFLIGGSISLFIIFYNTNLRIIKPNLDSIKYYFKDAFPIFSTEIVTTVKDKASYLFLGPLVGMHEVVVYDLGVKITSLLVKPTQIISRVLFPKISREKNVRLIVYSLGLVTSVTLILIVIVYLNIESVISFFIDHYIETNLLKIFLLAPLFLCISSFTASNIIIAFNHNKNIFYSIIITTIFYISVIFSLIIYDEIDNIKYIIILTVLTYLVELIYRTYVSVRILKSQIDNRVS